MSLKAGYKGIRQKFINFVNGKLLPIGIDGKLTSDNVSLGNGMTTDTNKKLVVTHGILAYANKEATIETASTSAVELTVSSSVTLTNRIVMLSLESSSTGSAYIRNYVLDNTNHKITVYVTTTSADVAFKVHAFVHY